MRGSPAVKFPRRLLLSWLFAFPVAAHESGGRGRCSRSAIRCPGAGTASPSKWWKPWHRSSWWRTAARTCWRFWTTTAAPSCASAPAGCRRTMPPPPGTRPMPPPASAVPEAARDPAAPARWRAVSNAPDWGWFDPRLSTARVAVPEAVREREQPAELGAWSVPVRLDGAAAAIAGHFRYRPAPHGSYLASLSPPADFPADLHLRLLPGALPAVWLDNRGGHQVTVLGLEGEPYLRVGARGVEVNLRSSHLAPLWPGQRWRRAGRRPAGPAPLAEGRSRAALHLAGAARRRQPGQGRAGAAAAAGPDVEPAAAGRRPPLRPARRHPLGTAAPGLKNAAAPFTWVHPSFTRVQPAASITAWRIFSSTALQRRFCHAP